MYPLVKQRYIFSSIIGADFKQKIEVYWKYGKNFSQKGRRNLPERRLQTLVTALPKPLCKTAPPPVKQCFGGRGQSLTIGQPETGENIFIKKTGQSVYSAAGQMVI